MNGKIFSALALAGAMVLAGVKPARAQDTVKATIPFEFNAGGKLLPAGDYEMRPLTDASVLIENVNTKDRASALARYDKPGDLAEEAVLVFHQYGDARFLSQICTRDTKRGLPVSKLERRAASKAAESAVNNPDSRVVYIAARMQ